MHRCTRSDDDKRAQRRDLREPHAVSLRAGLGIYGLVLRGLGHGQPGAARQLGRSASPQLARVRLLVEQAALTRSALPAGANAASPQATGGSLRYPAIDRLLTRSRGLQCLTHEHLQRHRRRVQPLAVYRQRRLGGLQQPALVSTLKNSAAPADPERRVTGLRR
jgi:hypothetical protein